MKERRVRVSISVLCKLYEEKELLLKEFFLVDGVLNVIYWSYSKEDRKPYISNEVVCPDMKNVEQLVGGWKSKLRTKCKLKNDSLKKAVEEMQEVIDNRTISCCNDKLVFFANEAIFVKESFVKEFSKLRSILRDDAIVFAISDDLQIIDPL